MRCSVYFWDGWMDRSIDQWKDLVFLIGEEHVEHLKVIRDYCLVKVAQEKYGGPTTERVISPHYTHCSKDYFS